MKEPSAKIKAKREVVGRRLREGIEREGITQRELLRRTAELSDGNYDMSPTHLWEILVGRRSLNDYASYFSEVLHLDPGYLMGIDGFQSASYEEYINWRDRVQPMRNSEKNTFGWLLNVIFPLAGYSFENLEYMAHIGFAEADFTLKKDSIKATIPASQIDRLIEEVKVFTDNKMKELMAEFGYEDEEQ